MKYKIILFVIFTAALTSCSSIYKSGQTPDDVYYSPARPIDGVVHKEIKKEEVRTVRQGNADREIVMGMYDPRWRYFNDDYDAYYDPYRYGYNCGYYYNPYYYPSPVYISGAVFINPKNTTPRMTNLGSYNYSNMIVVNPKTNSTQVIRSTRLYNNSNNNNYIRRVITPSTSTGSYNNTRTETYRPADNNTRTYSPSTTNSNSSSNSGSSSGSSGTPVVRPSRGGR